VRGSCTNALAGVIATDISRYSGPFPADKSIPQGAATSVYCALAPGIKPGAYYSDCREEAASKVGGPFPRHRLLASTTHPTPSFGTTITNELGSNLTNLHPSPPVLPSELRLLLAGFLQRGQRATFVGAVRGTDGASQVVEALASKDVPDMPFCDVQHSSVTTFCHSRIPEKVQLVCLPNGAMVCVFGAACHRRGSRFVHDRHCMLWKHVLCQSRSRALLKQGPRQCPISVANGGPGALAELPQQPLP
jgi:hypothetical protein